MLPMLERSGIEIGKQQEAVLLVTRQLNRRFGNIDDTLLEQVRSLPVDKLEGLSDALLDFTSVTDFTNSSHSSLTVKNDIT
ncbi:hypothetical protein WA1_06150 [Scytonema hofmannii PCC 7110]|uniref:DUF4351 domain-containing protein n=1 Tax=Scytonema hofmannii PCC 7110 TaxID=128403 RepID=A0A139WSI6_9CYAN|nr:DUF4351 domain-containing protein [Scytonema hofmannii]KYC35404.1 hypothetical protein WA1_06150 [Scytonema hofmannii PCC 7110]